MSPSAQRALAALRCQPMTVSELSQVIGVSLSTARHAADALRDEGLVRDAGTVRPRRMGRPHKRIAA
jgi:DNA-binding transcriptional ArsR family regulator